MSPTVGPGAPGAPAFADAALIEPGHLGLMIQELRTRGYRVIGPRAQDGAIRYDEIQTIEDLPAGFADEQAAGHYRLRREAGAELFGYTLAPQGWKRHLYPPEQTLFSAERAGAGFRISRRDQPDAPQAFLGVRACELAAMAVQDKVFDNGSYADSGYMARRGAAFVIAVDCAHAGSTCFCASMGTGPAAQAGYDIRLAELTDGGRHRFLVMAGSEAGRSVLDKIPRLPAAEADRAQAARQVEAAREGQRRALHPQAEGLIKQNLESPHWAKVAQRCLTCASCTMVCPTCFCSTTEDVTDLTGMKSERVRKWDSCFTLDFSYIHGGVVRADAGARYRQWISHKLAHWHDQFGMSGCVGCGRCITWCPVGIDITAEVDALAQETAAKA